MTFTALNNMLFGISLERRDDGWSGKQKQSFQIFRYLLSFFLRIPFQKKRIGWWVQKKCSLMDILEGWHTGRKESLQILSWLFPQWREKILVFFLRSRLPEHAMSLQGCVLLGSGSSSRTKCMESVVSAGAELGPLVLHNAEFVFLVRKFTQSVIEWNCQGFLHIQGKGYISWERNDDRATSVFTCCQ